MNVLDLATRNGQIATKDPVVTKLLADIRASTAAVGAVTPAASNPSQESFTFPGAASSKNYYPTVRVDYNLTQKHRLTATSNYQNFENYPDQTNNNEVRFPGFPNTAGQTSWRSSTAFSVRSAFTPNLVNEARVAFVNYEVDFSAGVASAHFKGTSVADQNGYNLTLGFGLTGATAQSAISGRQAPVREYMNTLNWIKGSHSLSMGGSLSTARLFTWSQTLVPGISFGVDASEAANNMFSVANFPNASNTNLSDARALYALLTGRVSQISGNAVLDQGGQYVYNGDRVQRGRVNEVGLFVQDSWRVRPGLTINGGVRWELQMPFQPDADNYTTAAYADVFGVSGLDASGNPNLFKPSVLTGRETQFIKYGKGTRAYNVDYGNVAPTVGAAWSPRAPIGWLRRLMGKSDGDSVIRAGYAMAFSRNGMSDYSTIFGGNPGSQLTANRNTALGNLNLDGLGLPVLFRDINRLGPPPFSSTPDYPLTLSKGAVQVTNSVNVFDPNMKTPSSHSWNVGWSRVMTRSTAFEVRYVGTRGRDLWQTVNYNEFNIVENGFLDEFRKAQANLQANIAAGRGNTFAYAGAGTSPLPIFLAFFNGLPGAQAGDVSRYTGSNWTNSTFLGYLAAMNPQPYNFASASTSNTTPGLLGDATRRANAAAAGLPANFFVVNPGLLGGANVRTNVGYSHYDALQIELRRRFSQGLQAQASYAYGNTYTSDFFSVRRPILESIDTGSPGSVPHAFKADWVYELPFGRGRRFAGNVSSLVDRIIGGWSFAGTARVQTGQVVDFGNVRLVGMTTDDLKQAYGRHEYAQIFTANGLTRVYRLPQDIVENTFRANDVSATSPTGYGPQGPPTGRYLAPANGPGCIEIASGFGDCGVRTLTINAPPVQFYDLSAVKRVRISGKVNAEFRGEFLNAFNLPTLTGGTTGTVTPSASRTIQLVSRVNW